MEGIGVSVATSSMDLSQPVCPSEFLEKRWYAVLTSPRHEKCVATQMRTYEIEYFLPLYKSVRRWKDRRKHLELPLFPGYLFVRIALQNRLQVLRLPGVAQLIGKQGHPSSLPEQEIETLRHGLISRQHVEPHPFLKEGKRVRVVSGPMTGIEGILYRRKDGYRVVLSVDLIQRSFSLEVDEADIALA